MYTCLAALRRTAITRSTKRWATMLSATLTLLMLSASAALAQPTSEAGGEASLRLPDLSKVSFLNGAIDGHKLLLIGILFCVFGLLFGLAIYMQLKNLPVHRSMREISELIYETCKTYLVTQGKFLLILWAFIARHHRAVLRRAVASSRQADRRHLPIILLFSLVGIARQLRRGLVRHPRQHLRQLAHRVCRPARQAVSRSMPFR